MQQGPKDAKPHACVTPNRLKEDYMKIVLAFLLAINMTSVYASEPGAFVVETNNDFAKAIKQTKQAVTDNNFRIVRETDLSVNGFKIHAIWFCNFKVLNDAIHKQKNVGYMLPFRITVMEHNGKTTISTTNPDNSSKLFNSDLGSMFDEITQSYKTILDEASL
jgi:cytochrome c oxidase cbb3-type subunit 3